MLASSPFLQGLPFSQSDVMRAVSPSAWDKAQSYLRQGRVSGLRIADAGEHLEGKVKGTARRPYAVRVCAHPIEGHPDAGPAIVGTCTCPVADNCKHVAALLMAALSIQPRFAPVSAPSRGGSPVKRKNSLSGRRPATELPLFAEDPPLLQWLKRLDNTRRATPDARKEVLYVIGAEDEPGLTIPVRPWLVQGGLDATRDRRETPIRFQDISQESKAWKLPQEDIGILAHLRGVAMTVSGDPGVFLVGGEAGAFLLDSLLATGRCHWGGSDGPRLRLGSPRAARPDWIVARDGSQRLTLSVEGGGRPLPFAPPWYVDVETGDCGALEHQLSERALRLLYEAPPLSAEHALAARGALEARTEGLALPLPLVFSERRVRSAPVPELHLLVAPARVAAWNGFRQLDQTRDVLFARLTFDYEDCRVRPFPIGPEFRVALGETLTVVERELGAERELARHLYDLDFADYPDAPGLSKRGGVDADFVLGDLDEELGDDPDIEPRLLSLLHKDLPKLEAKGWRITLDESLPIRLVHSEGAWTAGIEQQDGEDWFGLSLGIQVNGRRMELLPILLRALEQAGGWAALRKMGKNTTVFAPLDEKERLALPAGRLRAVLETLADLVDGDSGGTLRLPRARAGTLAELEEAIGGKALRWQGSEPLRKLGRRLRKLAALPPVQPPAGLQATLRPYQIDGLAWLNFLREQGFGGILADDMGLGKTVQALALLLLEQEAGRLDRPSLIVAPTSVLGNWVEQASRFAPNLRVLLLHGPERKTEFPAMASHELVLTSYALLHRDEEIHLAQPYHVAIFDEAQYLKNPETHFARIAGKLQARFRLCLTGTPMENHLGELWSLMHVLMPGLLGNRTQFRRVFQIPVEKRGEAAPRQALARRVAPFLLRRGKDEVAPELPAKTDIRQAVTLEGAQRDLYETVRLAMHEKVRAALDSKGLDRSRIVILDALLKLRQVCCDPRLVKLSKSKNRAPSAKLARLLDLLPEMIEEGRRVLLFSQFTSMLALIEPELAELGIDYVKLTGDTKDRGTPIARFQSGEVPLFLLSLRAGGTGLNLTAADTVIHYDPWWNPAVENQATDRAHRIGQDKPVFVHKLLASGTVEERIVAMQERKAGLLQALFDETGRSALKLTGTDVEHLLAPLEG